MGRESYRHRREELGRFRSFMLAGLKKKKVKNGKIVKKKKKKVTVNGHTAEKN